MNQELKRKRARFGHVVALALVASLAGGSNAFATTAPSSGAPEQLVRPGRQLGATEAAKILPTVTFEAAHAAPLRGRPLRPVTKAKHAAGAAGDLIFHGGPTVVSAASHNVYVNAGPGAWGFMGSFLGDNAVNGADQFPHNVDQYIGSNVNDRYSYGGGVQFGYNTNRVLGDGDIYALVNAAGRFFGAGYTNIYHVFLLPGVQQCSNAAGGCYAVNYCAYHGSVTIGGNHFLYSVEPWQGINGCQTPNGNNLDSQASTLTHELFETITDPDLNAWYNAAGEENGDLCRFNYGSLRYGSSGASATFFNRTFQLQQEYDNGTSDCSY